MARRREPWGDEGGRGRGVSRPGEHWESMVVWEGRREGRREGKERGGAGLDGEGRGWDHNLNKVEQSAKLVPHLLGRIMLKVWRREDASPNVWR